MRALFARFPQLEGVLPHVDLGVTATPLERYDLGAHILVKRDDASAAVLGGNKVRALEFLLAGARRGDRVLTVGSTGSTHALATATHARSLGLDTDVITWPQEDNAVSLATRGRLAGLAGIIATGSPVQAYLRAARERMRGHRHWIAAGGSTARGALGHVSAALELVEQLRKEEMPVTDVVVPLGSGGTAAGLLAGFSIARAPVNVVGVRVVPRLLGNRGHVLRIAWQAHRLVGKLAAVPLPPLRPSMLAIVHGQYGGAYGRESRGGTAAAAELARAGGPALDATYTAKAFAAALFLARGSRERKVLFWLTFDGRWLAGART